jgi:hypothetical protein
VFACPPLLFITGHPEKGSDSWIEDSRPPSSDTTHDLGFRKLTNRRCERNLSTANLACCSELLKAAVGLQSDSSRFEPSQKFDKKVAWRFRQDGVCWPTSKFASGVSRPICNSRGYSSHPVPACPCVDNRCRPDNPRGSSHEAPHSSACACRWTFRLH